MTNLGIQYPYKEDNNNNFKLTTTTKEQVRSDINTLIVHNVGDRYMMPYFGVNLMPYLFEPITDQLINDIRTSVSDAIQKFIFGVRVRNVQILLNNDSYCIGVNVEYEITDGYFTEQDFVEITF